MQRKKSRRTVRKVVRRRPVRKAGTRAIVPASAPVVYRGGQPVKLDEKQIDLIKSLCAKDSTPEEFELFMQICRKSNN